MLKTTIEENGAATRDCSRIALYKRMWELERERCEILGKTPPAEPSADVMARRAGATTKNALLENISRLEGEVSLLRNGAASLEEYKDNGVMGALGYPSLRVLDACCDAITVVGPNGSCQLAVENGKVVTCRLSSKCGIGRNDALVAFASRVMSDPAFRRIVEVAMERPERESA